MNRATQNQLINLAHMRANKAQFSSKDANQADLTIEVSGLKMNIEDTTYKADLLFQGTGSFTHEIEERQGPKEEEQGLDNDIQCSMKGIQFGNELEIPEVISRSHLSLSVQLTRVKAMKMEEIKKEFYNEKSECLLCGAVITRPFKGHAEAHIKKEMTFEAGYTFHPKSNEHPFQMKCKTCPRIFVWTDGEKKLHDHSLTCKARKSESHSKSASEPTEKRFDSDLEVLEKKFKGEISTLKKHVLQLEKQLAKTEKKVTGVYKTQGTMKKELQAFENRVGGLEEKVETVSKTVEVHESTLVALLNQFINQGKNKDTKSSSILDRLKRKAKV